jgi:hypothetical protein
MMTSEERLDRLERIAKLFVRAGLRERRSRRELEAKLDIIVDYQMANEERFAKNEERFAKNEERFAKLTETVNQLVEAQKRTDQRLDSLIKAIERDRNGHAH